MTRLSDQLMTASKPSSDQPTESHQQQDRVSPNLVVRRISIRSTHRGFTNDSDCESSDSTRSSAKSVPKNQKNSDLWKDSYYHTNAMTIYNDITTSSQPNLARTNNSGDDEVQLRHPARALESKQRMSPSQEWKKVAGKPPIGPNRPVSSERPNSGYRKGRLEEQMFDRSRPSSFGEVNSRSNSNYLARGYAYRASTGDLARDGPSVTSSQESLNKHDQRTSSSSDWGSPVHSSRLGDNTIEVSGNANIKSGSSVDLRSYAMSNNAKQLRDGTEEIVMLRKLGLSRSRSAETNGGTRSKTSSMTKGDPQELWTDSELYTDRGLSDCDSVESSDFVLDTTAYVCAIIDSMGLTEEERSSILKVVARDERLRLKEKQRIIGCTCLPPVVARACLQWLHVPASSGCTCLPPVVARACLQWLHVPASSGCTCRPPLLARAGLHCLHVPASIACT
ncbi:hypothetical protein FHG87_012007 [Trinorchestia longiramus]|nr:hypothetical protein FHG87_012007 [Trinorchestia longiramus]